MFQPSQHEVRRFFCQVYGKQQRAHVLDPLESLAAEWIESHPEYHDLLSNEELALNAQFPEGQTNPFLHLSMHLSISEQCSIDQPRGIRQAVNLLASKQSDRHQAHHQVMECLGVMLWESQRSGLPPDGQAYVAAVSRLATRD